MDGLWVVDTRALTTREKCRKCVVINKTCVNAHDDSIDFSTKQLILYLFSFISTHLNSYIDSSHTEILRIGSLDTDKG
jgi:hypothetical protein